MDVARRLRALDVRGPYSVRHVCLTEIPHSIAIYFQEGHHYSDLFALMSDENETTV